ncbi:MULTISPECIES: condensation domain-containing protein [unclassified Corynebacterium]|uniref:condensation domain-containing protein n=1 Tax=unclassified Corynebacterium TaxID=2624378 RepID=UPI0029CA7A4B|nr:MULTISPECIES: condensation domain-containing protein [unclassified Corynebacterium]WPF65768.1 condensation domain-containing protein [Corynebacterium sp. 22KM0430]WPF68262.1 condensation domain-containing protein [Corynebacterium sp. 21KM1197]
MSTPDTALLPLTGAQRGIFDAQMMDPHSPLYVVGEVLELTGSINPEALCAAIEATQREVDTLRIRVLVPEEGEPGQYVSGEIVAPVVRDLREHPHPERLAQARIDAAKTTLAERTRGLAEVPLCHYEVLRLGQERTWVIQLYHHLIVDGYSATLLTRRIAEYYTAAITGKKPKRYRGAALAQIVAEDAAYADSPQAEEDREFFRDLLDPLPDLTERERLNAATGSAQTSGTTVTTTVRLAAADQERCEGVARELGSTWVTALVALYAAQLWHTQGRPQGDMCLAMPMMARASSAQRATPHMAVNVLPLLVPVLAEASVADLLAATDERLGSLREHQRYRGENLPRDLGVPGAGALLHGMGVNAKIFHVRFDFAGTPGVLRNVAGGPPEDFGLVVMPAGDGGIDLGLETDPVRVPEEVARRRLRELRDLLVRFGRGEAGSVADLLGGRSALTERIDARAGHPAPERGANLRELIDALADTAEASLITEDGPLSGMELHRRVRETARRLPQGGPIAIDLPRNADLVVTVLAALYAGVPFTYLEAGAPQARREQILSALGATWVAGRDPLPERPQESAPEPQASDLAYVIFTSGSTGAPKGVQITRGNLEALLGGHLRGLYRRPRAVVGHTASFAFDAALDQLLWLLAGHCVRLYPEEIATDAEAALGALRRDRVTVFDTTPSLAAALMAAGLGDLPDLEALVLGGEALPAALWDRLAASGLRVVNAYGPTEACIDALMAEVTPGAPVIGVPVAGMRAYALTENRQVAADFERGRLYLAGPQVARGYLDSQATEAAFITATVDPRRGPERLYDTGDLVRWIPGRGYEYLGRVDDQVEINGRRVELGEVEAALLATEGVAAATVTPHGRAGLIGWVVPESGAQINPRAVREAVAGHLPAAMVPGRVEVLAELPTTVSGKADRKALRERAEREPEEEVRTQPAPENPAAQALLEACAEQTGTAMSADADFISQGGDSISALTVATQLRRQGWVILPKDLLAGTPLGAVASGMTREEQGGGEQREFFLPIGALPESPVAARQRAAAPTPEAWAGFAQYAEIPGPQVTPEVLGEVVSQLLRAHGALRAILDSRAGEYLVPRVPLGEITEYIGTAPVANLAEVAARPALLDPEAGRMVHAVALHGGGVGLVVHHSGVDALSWATLRAEVRRILRGGKLAATTDAWRAHCLRAARRDHGAEIPQWLRIQRAGEVSAGEDLPARAEATCRSLDIPKAPARALTEEPEATMLAALALSVGGYLGVEGHGRESDSTTVGWFTIEHPLSVAVSHSEDPLADAADALAAARRARGRVPGAGEGYGWLAHGDAAGALHGIGVRPPQVVLNVIPGTGEFQVVDHPQRRLTEALTVNVFLAESRIEYTADPARFDVDRVHAEILRRLGHLLLARRAGIGDAPRRALERRYGPIEKVLLISPQQEGLLFHTLSAAEDPYALAMGVELRGGTAIDVPRLARAWRELLRRHPALCAGFDATTGENPVQFIPRDTPETFRVIDLRGEDTGATEAARNLAEHLLHRESTRQVSVSHPPLVRATAIWQEEHRLRLILTGHHLLTDGWSTGIMLREFLALYHGEELPAAPRPEVFLDWLAQRREEDRRVWRAHLEGVEHPTLVARGAEESGQGERALPVSLSPQQEAALVATARGAGATPAELLQVAWAYVLAELTGQEDEVLCGVTVSGRPPELPETAQMIGLFAATVPARIRLSGDPLADLRAHHATRTEMAGHTAASLADMGASGLFDTIVVYENAPAPNPQGDLVVTGTQSLGQTHYPITVLAQPGRDFDVVLAYRPGLVDTARAEWAARRLGQVLGFFLGEPLPRDQRPPEAPAEKTEAPESVAPAVIEHTASQASGAPSASLIAEHMAEVLDCEVTPETVFSEAGGHSLLAVRLLGRLQRAGLNITIGDILAGGSPRGIAARLGAGGPSATASAESAVASSSPLVVRTIGARTLWCMPPGDGLHTPWADLAARIPLRVRAVIWAGEIEQPTLDRAVADIVALIRAEQPHGPYYLAGWSFGGVLAHAVAHALGGPEQVAFLGILDSYPVGVTPQGLSKDADPTPLVDGLLDLPDNAGVLRELVERNLVASGRLMAQAKPLPWQGSVHLVVGLREGTAAPGDAADAPDAPARGVPTGPQDWNPEAAWARAGARVERLDVDADHFGLVRAEGWAVVAPFLAAALEQAERARSQEPERAER